MTFVKEVQKLDKDKYLSEREARRLMEYSEAMSLRSLERGTTFYVKAWAVIHTLLGTGTRASECRKIKIGNLHLGREPSIKVVGKGKMTYKKIIKEGGVIVFPDAIIHLIQEWDIDRRPVVIRTARVMKSRPMLPELAL